MFLDGCSLRKSFRYTFSRFFSPVAGLIFLGAWLLAIVTGPFGTFEGMAFEWRAIYWLIITIGAFLLGHTCFALALGFYGPQRQLATALTAALFMTILFTPYTYFLRHYFSTITEVLPAAPSAIALNILLISIIVLVLRAQLVDDAEAMKEAAEPAAHPRLSRRLPEGICKDVVRLEAQNHQIAVITMSGRETVRMRFGDAIEEMEPLEGFCTHRSHWVVENAIMAVEQDRPGKILLRMRNGDRVPVSRKYRPQLDARGFEIG